MLAFWTSVGICEPATAPATLPTPIIVDPSLPEWSPTSPVADSHWDWLQLTSGEWLKGELLGMEKSALEFDSDKLGIVSLDWEDVQQLMSARPMAILYGQAQIATGYLITEDQQLLVLGPNLKIPLSDVIGIAKDSPDETDRWTGTISVSMNLRTGNVEQQDINNSVDLRRRTAQSSLRFQYLGNYSYYDSEENINDHRASLSYDYRLDRDWFLRPISLEFFRDPYQNIQVQWTVGTGAGLYVIDNKRVTWTISMGPGYQKTRFSNRIAAEDRNPDSAIFFISTQYDHELTASTPSSRGDHASGRRIAIRSQPRSSSASRRPFGRTARSTCHPWRRSAATR